MIRRSFPHPMGGVLLLVFLLIPLLTLPSAAQQGPRFHTRSIVACDPTDASCGIAVVSFPTGVPAVVPVGEAGVSVANQSFPSLATAEAIVDGILNGGLDAPTALANALAADPAAAERQLGVAALFPTPSGVSVANHTGASNTPETCDVLGDTYAVQANLQTSSEVCGAMAAAFEAVDGSLARRLLAALLAGSPIGGDARGEYSASIKVYSDAWALASITELGADAGVNRAANWEEELAFNLNAFLGTLTPPDPRDLVELTRGLAKDLQRALKNLRYYQGPVNGVWSDATEQALLDFGFNNIFFENPTVLDGGIRFIDGPLADYILTGEPRDVFVLGEGDTDDDSDSDSDSD